MCFIHVNSPHFMVLLLLARPGAGKSEVIEFLKGIPLNERITRYHVADIQEIDDFPMLWTWFEEDYLLREMGRSALFTDQEGYFLHDYLWDLLIKRISLEFDKKLRDTNYLTNYTTIIEFSRGKEHGGFSRAFQHLSTNLLSKSAILYIDVSWEQSLLKNRKRFNPDKPDSILEHSLPDAKLERLYRESDWKELVDDSPERLLIKDIPVPYVIMENEDDVTTARGAELASRLEQSLTSLWSLYTS